MRSYTIVTFLVLWVALSVAYLSTKELLECRANVTAIIRNETMFLEKVRQSDYIFTGKIKEFQHGQLHTRVKRVIKGMWNSTFDLTLDLDTCVGYIRRGYTGIFMARHGTDDLRHVGKIMMHFGPVPLTLANLDRLNAAIRGECHGCFSHSQVLFRLTRCLTKFPCSPYKV